MSRVADVLPQMAAALGLEEQLRLSRAMASWERLVAELVPPAAGASRLIALEAPAVIVSATAPIVAQELRLRASELLAAFARVPGGVRALELRIVLRPQAVASSRRRPDATRRWSPSPRVD